MSSGWALLPLRGDIVLTKVLWAPSSEEAVSQGRVPLRALSLVSGAAPRAPPCSPFVGSKELCVPDPT